MVSEGSDFDRSKLSLNIKELWRGSEISGVFSGITHFSRNIKILEPALQSWRAPLVALHEDRHQFGDEKAPVLRWVQA